MILGLDMSTKKTGYGLLDYKECLYECGIITSDNEDIRERMKNLYNAIEKLINKYKINHIVFEDVPISKHKNLQTGKTLCILQGVILSLCFKYDISYSLYAPSAWRSVIGTYDGTKEGTKREAQKMKAVSLVNSIYKLGFEYYPRDTKAHISDDDKAEAILIALSYIKELGGQINEI